MFMKRSAMTMLPMQENRLDVVVSPINEATDLDAKVLG